ncbi:hypothetical protein [Oceanobacillus halotolerans]|uniref:hypothetical protein n=1 Tax=Oceanobacillus halotolerans TaxID=2663380 RepID=UPI0013DD23F8|nr:hypothetical protein [Oceanobacillus halotolerans]
MKIKVATFGREDIIERIQRYAEDMRDIEIVPFVYKKKAETTMLVEKAIMCDIYLFTTPLAYLYAKEKIEKKRLPAIQISFDEYMLLSSFYRINNEQNQNLNRFSIDIQNRNHVREVLKELNLTHRDIYTYGYGDNSSTQILQIVNYHKNLWETGKVDYVLTSIEEVEHSLAKAGIPAYTMEIPKINIDHALQEAKSITKLNQSKSAQIVVGYVRVKQFHDLVSEKGKIVAQETLLTLHRVLLRFGKLTYSSVLTSDNQFVVFGTKGILDHITNHYRDFPLIQELERALHTPVEIGFGLGLTAKQAEDNAKCALEVCANDADSNCYIVNERQDTIGPLGVAKPFKTSELYHALIHQAKLNNELSYNFIDFITTRNNEPFSSNDIASFYSVTKRSAERTVNKLLSGNVIKAVGEEKPYLKGRPRKLFQLDL